MVNSSALSTRADTFDVVIVGFGMAGACAAIEARDTDAKADILVIEKMAEEKAGGNARASGQSLLIARDADALMRYQRRLNAANPVPEEMLSEWARRMVALEPWIKARAAEAGARYVVGSGWSDNGDAVLEFPEFGAGEAIAHQATVLPTPSGVWLAMKAAVAQRNMEIRYASPVVDLIQDPDTLQIVGVVAEVKGERNAIAARRGVVLCCGGYENAAAMQRDYVGLSGVCPLGTPGNTGDGIRMLQKAGADLWHMRNRVQSGGLWPSFAVSGFDGAFLRNSLFTAFSWIDIGTDGRRFYNETAQHHLTHYKQKKFGLWDDVPIHQAQPVHMIFDEATRTGMCLATKFMTWNAVVERYRWSEDNSEEVAQGWIKQAATIRELAPLIARDPERLAQTVAEFNNACRACADQEFDRSPDTLRPISQPPFYAIRLVPGIICTSGGGRRNIESQVLTPTGSPIPRLFEAGELGSMISDLYQNGTYLTEAMISGRAAGRNAVLMPDLESVGN